MIFFRGMLKGLFQNFVNNFSSSTKYSLNWRTVWFEIWEISKFFKLVGWIVRLELKIYWKRWKTKSRSYISRTFSGKIGIFPLSMYLPFSHWKEPGKSLDSNVCLVVGLYTLLSIHVCMYFCIDSRRIDLVFRDLGFWKSLWIYR